jgi:hypothetical protein
MVQVVDKPWFPPWVESNPRHLEKLFNGDDVAAYLRKACEVAANLKLPNGGCIAGGAIANLLYDLVYPDELENPITDVDWFVWRESDWHTANTLGITTKEKNNDDQKDGYSAITLPTYVCNEEHKKGKLNILQITATYSSTLNAKEEGASHYAYTKTIVDAFDLNCCMAALDLYHNRVYIHPLFLEFISNRQILLNVLSHPTRSLLRLRDKANKFNCQNIQLEADIIAQFLLYYKPHKGFLSESPGFFLGQKSLEKFRFLPADLRNAFKTSFITETAWTFAPTGIPYPEELNISKFVPDFIDLPNTCEIMRLVLQLPPDNRKRWMHILSEDPKISLTDALAYI